MKANELMIGDWVNLKNGKVIMPCKVTVIGHSTQDRDDIGTTVCVDLSKEFPTCIFDMDVITPIPLTPEILEKNGFKRSEVFVEWKYEKDDVYILWKPFPWIDIEYGEYSIKFPCEYVHELQHALKLCGINKTIEL